MPNRTMMKFVSMKTQAEIFKKEDAQRYAGRFNGKANVIGKKLLSETDSLAWKLLLSRNEALAMPRNDERFSKISTMHPCRSAKFAGTQPALADALKRGVGKKKKK